MRREGLARLDHVGGLAEDDPGLLPIDRCRVDVCPGLTVGEEAEAEATIVDLKFFLGTQMSAFLNRRRPSGRTHEKSGMMISSRCTSSSSNGWPAHSPLLWRRNSGRSRTCEPAFLDAAAGEERSAHHSRSGRSDPSPRPSRRLSVV